MTTLRRPEFNPNLKFTVIKPVLVDSTEFKVGDAFDKALVNVRLLRQLYDAKYIDAVDDTLEPRKQQRRRRFRDGGTA